MGVDIGAYGNLDIGAYQSNDVPTGVTIDLDASGLELESYAISVLVTNTVDLSASAMQLESFAPTVLITNTVNLSVAPLFLRSFVPTVIVGTPPTGSGFRLFQDDDEIVVY